MVDAADNTMVSHAVRRTVVMSSHRSGKGWSVARPSETNTRATAVTREGYPPPEQAGAGPGYFSGAEL